MGRKFIGRGVRVLLVIGLALVWSGLAQAAGEWEWTAGQGWIRGAGVSRPTPKEQLHYAYELEQKGEFMDSARQYFLLVQNFPASQEAGIGLQRLARCLFEMENYYTSYQAVEQVIKTYPNTGRMSDLVEIELRIAKKMMVSNTPDILAPKGTDNRDYNVRKGIEIVNSVIEHDPYGPVAAEAYLVKGEGNLYIGEINAARQAFETVRDEFPRSDFVERARLGILRCDSLLGQARPQELADQIEVVREEEAARMQAQRRTDEWDQFNDVDESIRQLAEVEAAKMLEQADQYRNMGTRAAVQSSEFLYNELIRRYPATAQAEEANRRLGNLKVPKESSKIMQIAKNINFNPFTWTRDPEPPWIVPQMDPEDMVMVDTGLGPIAGVPETAAPQTRGAATVRPAALSNNVELAMSGSGAGGGNFSPMSANPNASQNYSPASSGPMPAPAFIDAAPERETGQRVYTSNPGMPPPMPPSLTGREQIRGTSFANNPLPTISEGDLIPMGGMTGTGYPSGGSYGGTYAPLPQSTGANVYMTPYEAAPTPVYTQQPSYPTATYSAPTQDLLPYTPAPSNPNLGGVDWNTPTSDLVGPARRTTQNDYGYGNGYNNGYGQPAPATGYDPYPTPQYQQPQPAPTYQQPYGAPAPVTPPSYSGGQGGGWTFGEEFR